MPFVRPRLNPAIGWPLALAGLCLASVATRDLVEEPPPAAPANVSQPDMGDRLMEGLRQTEGCLGVDAAEWASGRNSIVAWFENKAAVIRWYESDMHRFIMGAAGGPDGPPLEHIDDDDIPIMVVATITMGGEPAVPGPIPFSQISIEMYTPLPGGASINGRLSPETFPIQHMRNLDPAPADGQ